MDRRNVRVVGEAEVGDLEARGRALRGRVTRGYRREDVDDFLSEVFPTIRGLLRENESLRAGGSPSRPPSSSFRLTPDDVQDRRLRGVRVGGYDMRTVDGLLDEATDLIAILLRENEALRSRSGLPRGGS